MDELWAIKLILFLILKERLQNIQQQMGRPAKKLKLEVETRWNSTFEMLQSLSEEKEPVAAALVSLPTDISPLTAQQFEGVSECLKVGK